MIRFVVNFILFGILFYAIWFFFPETFAVLVSWMGKFFEWVKEVWTQLSEKISQSMHKTSSTPAAPQSFFW